MKIERNVTKIQLYVFLSYLNFRDNTYSFFHYTICGKRAEKLGLFILESFGINALRLI